MAAAQCANVENGAAHDVQQLPNAPQVGLAGAHHEHQVGFLRTPLRPRDRGVHHRDALPGQRLRSGLGNPGFSGGGVQQQRAGFKPGNQPVLAQGNVLHHLAIGQHGDNDVTVFGNQAWRANGPRVATQGFGQLAGCRHVQVMECNTIARVVQVGHHGFTHDSEANESDGWPGGRCGRFFCRRRRF